MLDEGYVQQVRQANLSRQGICETFISHSLRQALASGTEQIAVLVLHLTQSCVTIGKKPGYQIVAECLSWCLSTKFALMRHDFTKLTLPRS